MAIKFSKMLLMSQIYFQIFSSCPTKSISWWKECCLKVLHPQKKFGTRMSSCSFITKLNPFTRKTYIFHIFMWCIWYVPYVFSIYLGFYFQLFICDKSGIQSLTEIAELPAVTSVVSLPAAVGIIYINNPNSALY